MEWSRLIQLFLPLLIKLLQGIATLPQEGQLHIMQALAAEGPEDRSFNAYTPQQNQQEQEQTVNSLDDINANVGRET